MVCRRSRCRLTRRNGILTVSAKDQATGKATDVRIESGSGLDESEIDRMVNEGEQFEEEDRKRREQIQMRNEGTNSATALRNHSMT